MFVVYWFSLKVCTGKLSRSEYLVFMALFASLFNVTTLTNFTTLNLWAINVIPRFHVDYKTTRIKTSTYWKMYIIILAMSRNSAIQSLHLHSNVIPS
jgi:hypothetical protein